MAHLTSRRHFLKQTGLVSTAWLLPSFLKAMAPIGGTAHRKLVVIQLSGGNDGLNTVVPWRNDAYQANRQRLALPKDRLLAITDDFAFNPGATGLKRLYDQGLLCVVQGVGYPEPDRSHFRSLDIWHSASASNEYWSTGWLGRYLDLRGTAPHDVIEVGSTLSLAGRGERIKALTLTDAQRLFRSTREPYFAALAQGEGHEHATVSYLYRTMAETYQSAAYVKEQLKPTATPGAFLKDDLGKQLRTVAHFINSGLDTTAYYVTTSGYDTHTNQLQRHERLLRSLGDNLHAFVAQLKAGGELENTVVMVFSEFGRRVKQNASNGTDHGTAGPVILIGGGLKKSGIFNPLPSLTDLDANGDMRFSVDFRSVYAAVLQDWLAVDARTLVPGARPLEGLVAV